MASIIENLEGLERRFDILISSDQIQNEIEKRLRLLSKTTKLHGFRPGKIPLKMITQMYGTQVQQDVLEFQTGKCRNAASRRDREYLNPWRAGHGTHHP